MPPAVTSARADALTDALLRRRRLLPTALAACAAALAFATPSALAATVTTVASGLENPRGLTFGPDGNLYVAEAGKEVPGGPQIPGPVPGVVFDYMENGAITRLDVNGVKARVATGLPATSVSPSVRSTVAPPALLRLVGIVLVLQCFFAFVFAFPGRDPERTVVNDQLQMWDAHNVFVIGAPSFPQNASGVEDEDAGLASGIFTTARQVSRHRRHGRAGVSLTQRPRWTSGARATERARWHFLRAAGGRSRRSQSLLGMPSRTD